MGDTQRPQQASIGYTVGRKHWNCGYATEAAGALLQVAFTRLRLEKVTSNCDAANRGSWRVMEKLGMRLVRTDLRAKYFKGEWRDWLEYSIERDDWTRTHSF